MLKSIIKLFFILIYITALTGCDKGDLSVAKNFIHTSTYTALIDSVSIHLSSIKADSVQTSGRESGLFGYYNNPLIGGQKATSYFGITVPENFNWVKDKEVIDSITFVLGPNGYSLGDTVSMVSIRVHQLTEAIEKNNSGYLNNINHVAYNEEPLGRKDLIIYPNKPKSIEVRLDDQLATNLVDFILENKSNASYASLFQEEFKGFAVLTDTIITKAILGLGIEDDTCKLRMYTHITNLEKELKTYTFKLLASSKHFTEINESNLREPWEQLSSGRMKLNEEQTNGECLVQSGNGYRIRVDFPYLNNLLEIKEQGRIVQANLILKPVADYLKLSELNTNIYLSSIDKINSLGDFLYTADGNPLTPSLVKDILYNENTYYSFDITDYLNSRLQETIIDVNQGLALTLSNDQAGTQLDYMVFGGHYNQQFKSELQIYYYYYDTK